MIYINVQLNLYSYKDDNGIYYIYSPELDLVGYGKTLSEAQKSFETVLKEYFNYGIQKGTLKEDLKKHGWKITSEGYQPSNKQLKNIKKNLPEIYSEFQQFYQIPLI